MKLSETCVVQLGWDQVLEALSSQALTPLGRAACLSLRPGRDPEKIELQQERCRQLGKLLDEGRSPPLQSIDDIGTDLERSEKGGQLSAEGIIRVARAMQVSSRVRHYLLKEGHQAGGALSELAKGTHDLSATGRDLLAAFDDNGELRDSASPELLPLRRTARAIADGIRRRLERMIRKPRLLACLADNYFTQRADRYVLPVRADTHEPVPGIVHDTSQSGATLFIEPTELVEEGNRLKIARAAVAEHERRILLEYTQEIAGCAQPLAENLARLAEFDLLMAAVAFRERLKAELIEVRGTGFNLVDASHPLMVLQSGRVVPNNIRMNSRQCCLVVTGPNAGGKTVVLKTIGLCCMLAQAGLAVPAGEGSRIGLFDELHVVIGDAQDISRGLSTFSAHISTIAGILDRAGPGALVLLDEVAADTDPRHGAALASAVLYALIERGATVVVTTHFDELKNLAYLDERFANASVGFDLELMEPTYALHPDIPGRSLTLDIARRLGVAEPVLQNAAERLDGSERDFEKVLADLAREQQALASLRRELAESVSAARREAHAHAQAAEDFSTRQREMLGDERAQLLQEISGVRRKVAEMIESLRSNLSMKAAVETSQRLKEVESDIRGQIDEQPRAPAANEHELHPGDNVRIASWGKQAQVTAVDSRAGMVSVRMGSIRSRLPIEQLEWVSACPPRRSPRPRRGGDGGGGENGSHSVEVRAAGNTLDLRGQRVDESLDELDKFLDNLFATGQEVAFIIHGHGSGALRAAVRDYLKGSPYPRHFRPGTPEEGADGVTVVKLK
ncbi:MAG TPA: Smr/MutS family protein [Myxococcota bacterium]|nr:Smr/MutS family protein [Myxococcota bacterium]